MPAKSSAGRSTWTAIIGSSGPTIPGLDIRTSAISIPTNGSHPTVGRPGKSSSSTACLSRAQSSGTASPCPLAVQRKQQQKLDKETAKLESQTPEEKQRRAADFEKSRRRERAFLLEIPDAFDLKIEGSDKIDGQDVWVISGVPKPGYRAKTRDGGALAKIRGKMWIEKAGYQWVKVEAETTNTISFGLILARLDPGARLVLEQTRINEELWLPKRKYMIGKGRIALFKRVAEDDEFTWTDYKKFQVDSRIVPR